MVIIVTTITTKTDEGRSLDRSPGPVDPLAHSGNARTAAHPRRRHLHLPHMPLLDTAGHPLYLHRRLAFTGSGQLREMQRESVANGLPALDVKENRENWTGGGAGVILRNVSQYDAGVR